jgi:hypothetical protein
MSSASRSLHKNRSVLPRMYSLGCCRSFRMPLLYWFSYEHQKPPELAHQTRIISCFSFPLASSFGQIS